MANLTGKTIGQLALLSGVTSNTLFPVEYSGDTFHIPYSALTLGGGGSYEEVTYNELYSLYTGGTLTPGGYYLITDFQTCYDQPDFDSDRNPITGDNYKTAPIDPILVFATSANTLSVNAYQPSYPNDLIKYDITFNTTEVTSNPAKGRITERIDEFNNRTDYDHRTILFKRYQYFELNLSNPHPGTVSISQTVYPEMLVTGTTATTFNIFSVGDYVGLEQNDFKVYQIVSISSATEMYITGLTTTNVGGVKIYSANQQNDTLYYQNNVSTAFTEDYTFDYENDNYNNYIGNYSNLYQYEGLDFILANNVFKGFTFRNNTFGSGCYNNTFDDDCENNTIGNYFYNNSTDDDFDGNIIGNWFINNRITSNFQYNRIGENFENNYLVQSSFYRNNIMNYFQNNIIDGNDFQNNEIGSQFGNNKIINGQFYKNDIGNGFNYNEIYSEFYGNLIGNGYNNNNIYCYFYENNIGEIFNGNNLGNPNSYGSFSFDDNKIGNNFSNNVCLGDFRFNIIGASFSNNTVGDNFGYGFSTSQGNVIGNYCYSNTFGEYFYNNVIADGFYSNTIVDYFQENNIKVSISSTDFTSSTHVYGDYNCEIFKRSDTAIRLSYYDSSDILNITNITD